MPSQRAKKTGHQAEGTPGFFVSQLLQQGKKSWRLSILSMSGPDRFSHGRGDALEQLGIDGAENLAEDDQVPEAANGVRLFHRVNGKLDDFVTFGEHAVEHLKDVGIAQMLKQLVSIKQGLGMLDGSLFQTFPQWSTGIMSRHFEWYGARHRVDPFLTLWS
jgi:hypothetical protein